MADIALSGIQRTLVHQRQTAVEARDNATRRLATGLKSAGLLDNTGDSLRASALTSRAQELSSVKADIGRGIDTLAANQAGLEAIDKLASQLKGIAYSAAGNADQRPGLAAQFDQVRQQMDLLAGDVSFRGTNLVSNPPDSLRVSLSDKPGTELTVDGQAADVASLGIGSAATDYANFGDLTNIESAIDAVDTARSSLRSIASSTGSNAAILQVRDKFTQDLSNILESGAGQLQAADLTQEAARAAAANTRDALAGNALRLAARSDAALAGLLGG